jgi:hypothetical protein
MTASVADDTGANVVSLAAGSFDCPSRVRCLLGGESVGVTSITFLPMCSIITLISPERLSAFSNRPLSDIRHSRASRGHDCAPIVAL